MVMLRAVVAAAVAGLLGWRGLRKKSLSPSGAAAAVLVGFLSFLASFRFGLVLIAFYQSSSSLTKFQGERKRRLEAGYKEGGQRDAEQVFSCSLLATVMAVVFLLTQGEDQPVDSAAAPMRSALLCAYLGHYACCNGDTWASELGTLDSGLPRLVLAPWRKVPKGTNGGMSFLGTAASLAGGLFIGLVFVVCGPHSSPGAPSQLPLIALGAAGGFVGSLIDSFLGATLQATFYHREKRIIVPSSASDNADVDRITGVDILSNEQVNALSVAITTALSFYAGLHYF
uniref:Transmembrane protein 19 n=1 Tax=Rhizochromulina marina TaxID=1034831 RepID=A0A7S2RII1_9STRA|mmetsp:Transcript_16885/g.49169  ORF Transcript_16885/g.49169 Transcript_16885/m.49169 type:complete len:285 (+) Transcript_16885:16-870(+)